MRNRIPWILGILIVFMSAGVVEQIHARPGAEAGNSTDSQSASNAPLLQWSPAQPKWGEPIEISYDPKAPKAAFGIGEEVFAIVGISPGDRMESVKLERSGDKLAGRLAVPKDAGFMTVYVISLEKWDTNAQGGIMIYGDDGQPARHAWRGKMLDEFSPDSYRASFDKELALYPDNGAIWRDKWFLEGAFKPKEIKSVVEKELAELEKRPAGKESPEMLYSLSYGYCLLGREEAGRRLLRRLAETAPADFYTAGAFSNYDYQEFSQQWKGEGPAEVRKMAVSLMTKHPATNTARRLLDRHVMDQDLAFETAEAVCRAWIRDEPDNPNPYYLAVLAAKSKGGDKAEAVRMADRALDLLMRGKLRFFGDIGGQLTMIRMPQLYSLRAELNRDLGALANALADVKAAQTVAREQRTELPAIEASIWSRLGMTGKAEGCWVEAMKTGDKDAETELRRIFERRRGTTEGFSVYLAEKLKSPAAGGTASARKQPVRPFTAKILGGKEYKTADLKGRVVVLNFWYIGCAPCRVEMPGLNKLVDEFKDSEVVFLGVALDKETELQTFLNDHPFRYEIVPEGQELAKLLGVSVYPTHILMNKAGEIEYFLTGGSPDRHDTLRPLIQSLLR